MKERDETRTRNNRDLAPDLTTVRVLAMFAAAWAAVWLIVIMTPTGLVAVLDRAHEAILMPFEGHGAGNAVVARIVEVICLLPAAALLIPAQAIRKHQRETRAAEH